MPKVRKKKSASRGLRLSKTDLRELELHAENTYGIYQRLDAFAKNYAKKIVKGTYKTSRAIDGITNNVVPEVLRDYRKQYGFPKGISASSKRQLGQKLNRTVKELADFYAGKMKKKKKTKRKR